MIPNEKKAQHLPGYTPTARFVVTEPGRLPAAIRAKAPLHPELAGLLVITARKNFRGVETHIRTCRRSTHCNADEIVADIYHDLFGIDKIEEVHDHELLQKRWLREWVDGNLSRRSIAGIVTACYKPFGSNGDALCRFKVDFDERSVANLNQGLALFDLDVPKSEIFEEHDAWSGCIQAGCRPRNAFFDEMDLLIQWIVPDSIRDGFNGSYPCRTVTAMGHVFWVQTKCSTIRGAGLGAFLTVHRPSGQHHGAAFRLQRGALIDFGVYAPLRKGNRKLHSVAVLKDFVTGGKCAVYSWECSRRAGVFDITNDRTGKLLEEARGSVLTYVNEISHPAREAPSMEVQHDPSGAIHYLLGHMDPHRDDLVLEYGKEVELMVDYGEKYEKIRVRNGYPRVSGEALAELERECASEPADTLRDIVHWDAADVEPSIQFFFSACCRSGGEGGDNDGEPDPSLLPAEYRERLFAAVLTLHTRMKAIVAASDPSSAGSPGGTNQFEVWSDAVGRSRRILSAMLRPPLALICEALLENNLSRLAIQLALGNVDEASLNRMPALDVAWRLENLL
jgi:hypothetical protein